MKIKLLESNYLKALDINLKLNNNSKEKVSSVVDEISRNIYRHSSDLDLETRDVTGGLQRLFIPDEAKIERFDLTDWKNKKEISNRIRLDKSETFYFLMSKNDKVYETVIDGIPINNTKSSIPASLQLADYVLIIKKEEFLKTKAKKEERVTVEKSSVELRKTKRKEELFRKFETAYKELSKSKNDYYEMRAQFSKKPQKQKNYKYTPPKDLEPILGIDLKKGMTITMLKNPSLDDKIFKVLQNVSDLPTNPDDTNKKNVNMEVLDQETLKVKQSGYAAVELDTTYYIYKRNEENQEKDEKNDFEIEDFIPEINLKTLIKKDTTFPSNLFPHYGDMELRNKVEEIKSYWETLRKLIEESNIPEDNMNALFQRFEKSIKAGFKTSSTMYYIDKSGYEVDLGKYFDKAASIPPQVPSSVKEAYNSIFNYLTNKTKVLVEKIKELAEEGEYNSVSQIAYVLKEKGIKQFNNKFEKKVSNPEVWNRISKGYIRPQEVINEINEFKEEFEESILDINSIL